MYRPTPIRISKRTRTVLVVLGFLVLALIMWYSPTVPVVLLGGFAVALVLSFPVRWLSRIMPRWLAMLITFLVLTGLALLAFLILIPILAVQLVSFVQAVPDIVTGARKTLENLLQPLADYGLLQGTPDEFIKELEGDVLDFAKSVGQNILGGIVSFVSSTISLVSHPLRGAFRRGLLARQRPRDQIHLSYGGAEALQARRRRALGERRDLPVALPERAGARHGHTGRHIYY